MLHTSSSVHLQLHGTVYSCAIHISYSIALLYAILSLTLLPQMDIHTYRITLAWQLLMYSPTGVYRLYLLYR